MTTTAQTGSTLSTATRATLGRRALAGVVGGVAGGLVFGMLMAMMGLLPIIASMVGSSSAIVGFGVHILMSIMIGLGLTVIFGNLLLTSYPRGILAGLGYGVAWWVMGPLVVMPMMLGGTLFTINLMALASLMGHLIYGGILAAVAVRILQHRR